MGERLGWIARLVPFIDNWAVCDSFCQPLTFVKKDLVRFRPALDEYASSEGVYAARFALVAALKFYASPPWTETTLAMASTVSNRCNAYYVRLAAAWAVAECAALTFCNAGSSMSGRTTRPCKNCGNRSASTGRRRKPCAA